MIYRLLVVISILFFAVMFLEKTETFLDLNELEKPVHIKNECSWKDSENCDGDIPLITAGCNNVPNFPRGLKPKNNKINSVEYPESPFNRLAPKEGKYSFNIPELKYDGIYSRKLDRSNKCCWSTEPNKPDTYGTNKLFHIAEKSFCEKTICEPPECSGFSYGYPPEYYL